MAEDNRRPCESWCYVLPSILTLGSAISGLTAVRFAEAGDFERSVLLVLIAAMLDGLDGHVARYLHAVTEIGAELDSLCDLVNFGVTPSLVIFFWARTLPQQTCLSTHCHNDETVMWMACCAYLICCAFRLARFNVTGRAAEMDQELPEDPPTPVAGLAYGQVVMENMLHRRLYFQGVPAPVGAAYALTPLMATLSGLRLPAPRLAAIVALLATAVLMVSRIPTLSSKMLKTDRQASHLQAKSAAKRVFKVIVAMFLLRAAWHFPALLFLSLAAMHMLSLPVGVTLYYSAAADHKGN